MSFDGVHIRLPWSGNFSRTGPFCNVCSQGLYTRNIPSMNICNSIRFLISLQKAISRVSNMRKWGKRLVLNYGTLALTSVDMQQWGCSVWLQMRSSQNISRLLFNILCRTCVLHSWSALKMSMVRLFASRKSLCVGLTAKVKSIFI